MLPSDPYSARPPHYPLRCSAVRPSHPGSLNPGKNLVLPGGVPNSPPAGTTGVSGQPGRPSDVPATGAGAPPGTAKSVADTLAGVITGKPGEVKPSAGSPLNVVAVASDPAVVERQQAKVSAAQQAVAAAQARANSVAAALYTSTPGTGPPRSDLDAASQALFDARHNLTEQTATLAGLSQAREALGGQPVLIPALPAHADVQAFPPQPSAFAQASRAERRQLRAYPRRRQGH